MSKSGARKYLYDPRQGKEAIRLEALAFAKQPVEPSRTNYFSIYWIEAGRGEFWADAARHSFAANSLLFFTPYQYVRFAPEVPTRGALIQFHANFLCVETFHAESGCAGALFSDAFNPPIVVLDKPTQREVAGIVKRMHAEQQARNLAFDEMLLAQLKVLLILATRLKMKSAAAACSPEGRDLRHPILTDLKQLVDANFATLHAPSDYAKLLHMSPKALGRVVREQLGKSLTDLIRERILTHAKWQLLHTLKPVKEVAREVGFADELYFSRMFKKGTGTSPTFFREFETEIRGGSNLSMVSHQAPILRSEPAGNNSGN